MMNYSKRSDGRRLLVVIALFGILSTYGISAQNDPVTLPEAASTEESSEPTTATATAAAAAGDQSTDGGLTTPAGAGDQFTDGGLTTPAAGAETTSEAEKGTETSAGETTTQPGGSLPAGTGDEQTGSTEGGSSIAGEERTVETSTSDGKTSTAEGVSVRTGSDATGVESSAVGTDGGTTATVREAPSTAGSTGTEQQITDSGTTATVRGALSADATGTEKQITEGETTATVTGATSTDGKDEPLGAERLKETTGVTTAEDNTTSVKQTSKAADAQYTTNMGDTSAERQTETPAPVKVTVIAVNSTIAPIGCNSTTPSFEVCQNIPIADSPTGPVQWRISESVWEAAGKYYFCIAFQHQSNSSQRGVFPSTEHSQKRNCSTVVHEVEAALRKFEIHISSTPLPSTTSAPGATTGASRRRRRAAEAASAPSDRPTIVLPNIQLGDISRAVKEAIDVLTSDSNKNSASALPSSPQSTETVPSAKDDSTKAEDPKAVKEQTQTPKSDIWDAHRGIFVTVAILVSVCVVVTAFCCLCMKWRERGGSRNPEKHPIAMEEAREAPTAVSNPITDREMIQDEAPMQERENPAVTPNGGGQHISKADEDNGWVVPLDELSNAEKEKPEVENTRL